MLPGLDRPVSRLRRVSFIRRSMMSRRSTSVAALLRVALMALFALSAITFAPGTAAAAGTKTFTSDAYSFSVSWDSSSWTSKLGTGGSDGSVTLAAGASSIVINGFDGSSNDLNGCVSQLASKRKSSQDVSSFKQLTSGHVTVTAADGSTHRLYGFNVKNVAKVAYFECRPGAGNQFVSVSFETNDKGYDSALSLFDDVYQSITVGETTAADTSSSGPSSGPTGKIGSATKTPTPEDPTATATKVAKPKATATIAPSKTTKSAPVLKGNVYTGTNKGYTVTFDDAVWNDVKVIEPDGTGYDGLDINSDDTLGSIEAIPTSLSLKDCLSESISAMGKTDGFSDVVEAPDLEKPATVKGVVNAMVTFVVTTDTGTVNITRYIECRTLVKGASLLRIELAAGTVRATDVLPAWTALLAGIKVASVSGGTKATATATPKPRRIPKRPRRRSPRKPRKHPRRPQPTHFRMWSATPLRARRSGSPSPGRASSHRCWRRAMSPAMSSPLGTARAPS